MVESQKGPLLVFVYERLQESHCRRLLEAESASRRTRTEGNKKKIIFCTSTLTVKFKLLVDKTIAN